MSDFLALPLVLILSFLVGSIPSGYLLVKATSGADIRGQGSGNIGATNVARSFGMKKGALVFLLDVLKGAVPVYVTRCALESPFPAAAAVGAVSGHCFSIFLRFKGGKGVATGLGAFSILSPPLLLPVLVLFVVVFFLGRIISVASIAAAVTLAVSSILFGLGTPVIVASFAASGLILFRHKENIMRLARGEERRFKAKTDDREGAGK